MPAGAERSESPLLVFIHGGGCNSRYFDLPGFSVVEQAAEHGFTCLVLDRPGHGKSGPAAEQEPLRSSAQDFIEAIDQARREFSLDGGHLAIIGHSIGGAVALEIAASRTDVRAVAISGVGTLPAPEALAWHRQDRDAPATIPPSHFFFGPEGTHSWRGPVALRKAAQPWREEEIRELFFEWPARFAKLAKKVDARIHWRLSENERIWRIDEVALAQIASSLGWQQLDIALLPGGGHLYELHNDGRRHVREQLRFLQTIMEDDA